MAIREGPPPYFADLTEGVHERLKGLRVAWSPDLGFAQVDPEVEAIAHKAAMSFESLGCHLEETDLEIGNPFDFFDTLSMADTYVELGHLLEDKKDELYPDSVAELKLGQNVTATEYVNALTELWRFRSRMAEFFEKYDLLLTPANPVTAYPVGEPPKEIGGRPASPHWSTFAVFRVAWNVTGYPTASIPCGWSAEGLPVGLLMSSRWGREDLVLGASAAFEAIQPWGDRIPSIAQI